MFVGKHHVATAAFSDKLDAAGRPENSLYELGSFRII